jgi:ABC-type glutathione transport system ATPase component
MNQDRSEPSVPSAVLVASVAAIDVRGLSRTFGSFLAVKDLSFSVNQGEIFGFLGANGAGKSTTLRAISGLLRPAGGSIVYQGQPIGGAEPAAIETTYRFIRAAFVRDLRRALRADRTRLRQLDRMLRPVVDARTIRDIACASSIYSRQ